MMMKLGGLVAAGMMAFAFAACFAQVNQSGAQEALAAGRLEEAANDIQTALAHDPDNPQLKQLAGDIFTRRGVQYYRNGTIIAAADDFQSAVGYQPNYPMAWDYLGMIASQQITARKELLKVQSGGIGPYLPPGTRPKSGE